MVGNWADRRRVVMEDHSNLMTRPQSHQQTRPYRKSPKMRNQYFLRGRERMQLKGQACKWTCASKEQHCKWLLLWLMYCAVGRGRFCVSRRFAWGTSTFFIILHVSQLLPDFNLADMLGKLEDLGEERSWLTVECCHSHMEQSIFRRQIFVCIPLTFFL